MVQTRYFILTALLLLIAGAGAHAQLPDGTIRISGIRPAEVRFTSDGRYFMAKLSDTLRIYETATGVQAGGIPVPKVDGYAAGFLAGDSTVLVMRYNWGLYYHVWNWRKGVLVDSQKVWRTVQWAHVLGSGRKMVIKVPETTDPMKQYEMWNTIGEATYLGSFLDTSFKGNSPVYDADGQFAVSMVGGEGSFGNAIPIRLRIRPRMSDEIDTMHVSSQPFRVFRISPDGTRVTVSRGGGLQYVFDGVTRDTMFTLDIPKKRSVIVSMDYTRDNRYLVCTVSPDTSIARLEMRDGNSGQLLQIVAVDSSLRRGVMNVSPSGTFAVVYPDDAVAAEYWLIIPLNAAATGVEAIAGRNVPAISIDPNPARDVLNVEFVQKRRGSARLSLIGSNGVEVRAIQLDEREPDRYRQTLLTDGLPSGAYFLLVEESGVPYVASVRIEH